MIYIPQHPDQSQIITRSFKKHLSSWSVAISTSKHKPAAEANASNRKKKWMPKNNAYPPRAIYDHQKIKTIHHHPQPLNDVVKMFQKMIKRIKFRSITLQPSNFL
jgi:hypothetical protein